MSSSIQAIKLYGKHGPNPPKVRYVLEELGLPYDLIDVAFPDLKKSDFLAVNPNGRMPAIYDPNTDLTLWESGAIVEYLIERYDTEHKLSFKPGTKEAALARQWLFFQVSGQGPYFGQAVWFTKYHPEQIQSAKERYYNEIKRVSTVVEGHLQKQEKGSDGPWLVGGKFSYADLAWLPWHYWVLTSLSEAVDLKDCPAVLDWLERIKKQPGIAKAMAAS